MVKRKLAELTEPTQEELEEAKKIISAGVVLCFLILCRASFSFGYLKNLIARCQSAEVKDAELFELGEHLRGPRQGFPNLFISLAYIYRYINYYLPVAVGN